MKPISTDRTAGLAPLPTTIAESAVFLARHATPDWSRTDIPYHLPPGPPLTGKGLQEAQALGRFFQQAGVRQILCSPMERCYHTARIAAEIAAARLQVLNELGELQPGENQESLRGRLGPVFFQAAESSTPAAPLALVTHGGPVAFLLAELGLPPAELEQHKRLYDHRNPLPPAGAWRAVRRPDTASWDLELVFTPS